jgi:hypothetical protein
VAMRTDASMPFLLPVSQANCSLFVLISAVSIDMKVMAFMGVVGDVGPVPQS